MQVTLIGFNASRSYSYCFARSILLHLTEIEEVAEESLDDESVLAMPLLTPFFDFLSPAQPSLLPGSY